MDITINGNINIIGQQAVSLEKESTAEHSFVGLLDNEATFRELLVCLRERAKERVSETSGNTEEEDVLVKAKRSPGSEQLRSSYKKIAQITVGEATCEVYENGYAVFDNGDRKTVVWVPECTKAARYYCPLTYDERCREEKRLRGETDSKDSRETEGKGNGEDRLDEEKLADMAWYLAVVIAGENRIESNLEHPLSAGCRSSRNAEECESQGNYSWSCGAHFLDPEEALIQKEEKAERCADLSKKQREVYQLYYVDGFTQAEIAEMLDISQQAVSDRIESIRKKIEEYYAKTL